MDAGAALTERACTLNPNSAFAWGRSGSSDLSCGDPDAAKEKYERALRLSPTDPERASFTIGIARAHFNAGQYDDAILWAERTFREHPGTPTGQRLRVAAYAMAGRTDQARRALADLLADEPHMRLSKLAGFEANWRRRDD
jgi:adenylate cyclase